MAINLTEELKKSKELNTNKRLTGASIRAKYIDDLKLIADSSGCS